MRKDIKTNHSQKSKKQTTEKNQKQEQELNIFGFMEQSMNGLKLKSVGIIRATGVIGLINLTYNLFRYVYPERSRRKQVVRLNSLIIK
jgi:hypothetical protein